MEILLIIGVFVLVVGVPTASAFGFSEIVDMYFRRKEVKFNRTHPRFIWFREEYYKRNNALSSLYNEVRNCRKEIDRLLGWINCFFPDTDERKNLDDKLYEQRKRFYGCMKELRIAKREFYEFIENYAPPALAEIKYENSFDKWDKIYWNAKEKLAKMKSNVGSDILEEDL